VQENISWRSRRKRRLGEEEDNKEGLFSSRLLEP
jgi:hypothetical protein